MVGIDRANVPEYGSKELAIETIVRDNSPVDLDHYIECLI